MTFQHMSLGLQGQVCVAGLQRMRHVSSSVLKAVLLWCSWWLILCKMGLGLSRVLYGVTRRGRKASIWGFVGESGR